MTDEYESLTKEKEIKSRIEMVMLCEIGIDNNIKYFIRTESEELRGRIKIENLRNMNEMGLQLRRLSELVDSDTVEKIRTRLEKQALLN